MARSAASQKKKLHVHLTPVSGNGQTAQLMVAIIFCPASGDDIMADEKDFFAVAMARYNRRLNCCASLFWGLRLVVDFRNGMPTMPLAVEPVPVTRQRVRGLNVRSLFLAMETAGLW